MPRVLFVCTGNVCRSPMAEGFFREMTKDMKGMETDSAGLSAPDGRPPSQHSVDVLRSENIDITGLRSQQLTPAIVQGATHIFTMTQGHKEAIEMMFPAAAEKTFLVREFQEGAAQEDAERGLLDVPDPIGLGRSAYEMTRDLIKEAMPDVLKFVTDTSPEN